MLASVVVAVAAALASVAGNAATGSEVRWIPSMKDHYLRWLAGSILVVAAAALYASWTQRRYERQRQQLVPVTQRPDHWVVDRPAEVSAIVRTLRRRRDASSAGTTVAVYGAGGFGKTTVARLVRADRRVLRRFGGRVYWVTLGRDSRRGALVDKVNDLVRQMDPDQVQQFTDVQQAADHLAKVLAAGPPRLVVLDDVWFDDQLSAFPVAGRCARLVTTRVPSLFTGYGARVEVSQMSLGQARRLLTADLAALPARTVDALMVETGRWPLLLRLINKILVDQCRLRPDAAAVAGELLEQLHRDGVLEVDTLTGAASRHLDVADPDQRRQAVAATIEASIGLLAALERDRFAELATFIEDETIPFALVAAMWRRTGSLDVLAARALCARLGDLALLTSVPTDSGGTLQLHDVVRDFLRAALGPDRVRELNDVLLGVAQHDSCTSDWWDVPGSSRYLWDHLIHHLVAAGRAEEAESTATDLRWVAARLEQSDAAGPFTDLTFVGTPRATRLARLFARTANLLAPTSPPQSRVDILYSRVMHDRDWGAQAAGLAAERRPALVNRNRWPLPDLPHPALRRILTERPADLASTVALAIAPDSSWLITGSGRKAHIWDPVSGEQRAVLEHDDRVSALAVGEDGTWLAACAGDAVWIWDATTYAKRTVLFSEINSLKGVAPAPVGDWLAVLAAGGRWVHIWAVEGKEIDVLKGHTGWVRSVAIASDGSWLASAGDDGVRIWDRAAGRQRRALTGHRDWVYSVAIAYDRTWLASAGEDGTVRLWDAETGAQRAVLEGHTGAVRTVAIARDGSWLASAGTDRTVRLWDAESGAQRAVLTGHAQAVGAVAISPDGAWLASADDDGQVAIWDSTVGPEGVNPVGYTEAVMAVAVAPDGSWLATAGDDRTVRIWNPETGDRGRVLAGCTGQIWALAADGSWLVTAGESRSVRIWNVVTGELRTVLTGHTASVPAVAVAPKGTWLASGGQDGTVRIWDAETGEQSAVVGRTNAISALAIEPAEQWLATSGSGFIRIWDKDTGEQRAAWDGRARDIAALAIGPDGSWLVTGGDDRRVRIWNAETGEQRAVLAGHTDSVLAVAVTRDGGWLASAAQDNSLRIWDVAGEHCVAVMRLEAMAMSCAWGPGGDWIVVGGAAGLYQFAFQSEGPNTSR